MKKIIFILFGMLLFSSCAINRTYIKDYSDQMDVMRTHFPEIYDLYRQGAIVLDSLYEYEKDGVEKYHISYHYR